MSLHEIRSHTNSEVTVMLKSLERYHIIKNGQTITHDMIKSNPLLMEVRNRYEEEAYMMRDFLESRKKHGKSDN